MPWQMPRRTGSCRAEHLIESVWQRSTSFSSACASRRLTHTPQKWPKIDQLGGRSVHAGGRFHPHSAVGSEGNEQTDEQGVLRGQSDSGKYILQKEETQVAILHGCYPKWSALHLRRPLEELAGGPPPSMRDHGSHDSSNVASLDGGRGAPTLPADGFRERRPATTHDKVRISSAAPWVAFLYPGPVPGFACRPTQPGRLA